MSRHLGDYAPSTVIYGKFTTFRPSTGAAFTLGGTPALSVYKDNSTTQSTTGVTLTADFDLVTGLHHFAIDTSADGTFYSAGSNFDIVITTGTVDSVSVVGTVVGSFSIAKTSALRPTTVGRTLDVTAGGCAGVDWANVESPTTTLGLTNTTVGTVTTLTNLPAITSNWLTAAGLAADAVAEIQSGLASQTSVDDIPTVAEFEARTPTAAQLAYIVANAATGLPVTFTTLGGSTTAAVLNTVDGAAPSATNDQYNGRLLVFTDGTLKGVVTDITDYVGGTTTATITAIPTAPTSSHNARLI